LADTSGHENVQSDAGSARLALRFFQSSRYGCVPDGRRKRERQREKERMSEEKLGRRRRAPEGGRGPRGHEGAEGERKKKLNFHRPVAAARRSVVLGKQ